MDGGVVHSRVHGQEHVEDEHNHEKKSVLKKVKAKAKKIKNTITKNGHDHELESDYHYDNQHIPDDHDLDEEDDEDERDPEVQGAPIFDSAAVKSSLPRQVGNSELSRVNVAGTTIVGQEPQHTPRVIVVSPTTEGVHHNRATDPVKTFVGKDKTGERKVNLERQMDLEEDPHAPRSSAPAYTPSNYETKVTDPTKAGAAEIHVTPIGSSFTRMNIYDEEKPNPDRKAMATAVETQYPYGRRDLDQQVLPTAIGTQHPFAGGHNQNVSADVTQTQYPSAGSHDQFSPEPAPNNLSTLPENRPVIVEAFGTTPKLGEGTHHETWEKPSNRSSYTDKIASATSVMADNVVSAKNAVASKLGYGEQIDRDVNERKHEEHEIGEKHPSNQSSYTHKISSAGSVMADKAVSAKNAVASKLGYGEQSDRDVNERKHEEHRIGEKQPSNESSYTDKISSATSIMADKAVSAKDAVASKLGYGGQSDRDVNERKREEHGIGEKHPSNQSSYTGKISSATSAATSAIADKAISAKNAVASKLGYGEKGDTNKTGITHEEHKSGYSATNTGSSTNTSNTPGSTGNTTSMTGSAADYGKKIASTVTEKLAPVYGAVAGAGSAIKSKVPGTGSGTTTGTGSLQQDKGVSVKDYLADKLRPGDEDRALSEVISETLHNKKKEEPTKTSGHEDRNVGKVLSDAIHKREEEPEKEKARQQHLGLGKVTESEGVRRRLGPSDEKVEKEIHESYVNKPGQGMVDKVMDVVGNWFSTSGENQTSQGAEGISNKSVPEGGHGVQERRLQESSN